MVQSFGVSKKKCNDERGAVDNNANFFVKDEEESSRELVEATNEQDMATGLDNSRKVGSSI